MIQPLWRTVWSFLKRLKIEIPYDPASHYSAYTLRKPLFKIAMYHNFHCISVYNSQDMEAIYVSIDI